MRVVPLKAFSDNYVYVLDAGDDEGGGAREAAVVDPGEAGPVLAWLRERGRTLAAILVTHHHRDHVGGLETLLQRFPGTPVVASSLDLGRVPGVTRAVADGDAFELLGRTVRVLHVPGHTHAHVAYVVPGDEAPLLFCGDTLFGGTIGNLFEGTPGEMLASLRKIRALPPATLIYCSHEYTRATMQEAVAAMPDNPRVQARMRELAALPPDAPTVPLCLAVEREVNPFLRWDDPALAARFGATSEEDLFRRLCES